MSDPDSPVAWGEDGQPRSRLYGDVYFSTVDGLAESRAVFLHGCGLPGRWAGRRSFVVGELGFGSGLNIAALLDLWRRERWAGAKLHIFTIEAHPLSAAEAAQALAAWPELAGIAALMTARWPGQARGVHRIDLPELDAIIDVAILEVEEALAGWSGRADAWFLDGFSPALNPAMWRDEVLALVAARSAPGAQAATFTVAGQVRRGLAAAGFDVTKQPGFGRKRERLEGVLPGEARDAPTPRTVAIIGAGVSGAAAARAVRALGAEALVIDAEGPGAGASGNPAALVTPRFDAALGVQAALFARCFARAAQLYERTPGAVIARGVRQLPGGPRDLERFARVAASDLFEPRALVADDQGLDQRAALVIAPVAALDAWLGPVTVGQVHTVRRDDDALLLMDGAGEVLARADAVIVASGLASATLAPGITLNPVRGQLSWAQAPAPDATAWGGYAAPSPQGVMFGATHDRGDLDLDVREEDHHRNLATLADVFPDLAATLQDQALDGRAAIRAASPDHLPLAGAAPGADGVYLLTGVGGRGFSFAPLLAEHVAALALGAPSPLPQAQAALVDPGRFLLRAERAMTGGKGN